MASYGKVWSRLEPFARERYGECWHSHGLAQSSTKERSRLAWLSLLEFKYFLGFCVWVITVASQRAEQLPDSAICCGYHGGVVVYVKMKLTNKTFNLQQQALPTASYARLHIVPEPQGGGCQGLWLRPIDTVIRYTFVTYTIWDIMDRALGPWWNDLEIHYFFQWCPWWLTRLPPYHRGAAVVTSGGGPQSRAVRVSPGRRWGKNSERRQCHCSNLQTFTVLWNTMKLLEENFGGHFWGKTRWFCFIEKQPYSILQWQHLSFDMSQRDIVSSNLGQHCRWAKACGRGESSVAVAAVAAVTTCSSFVMSCRSDPWDPHVMSYCDAQLPEEWWIFSFLFGGQAMVGPSCLSCYPWCQRARTLRSRL